MNIFVVFMAIVSFATRLYLSITLWRLPLKNGDRFFLSQQVETGFYRETGAPLLWRYRVSVLVPLVLDAPLVLWLVTTQKLSLVFVEQFLAIVVTIVLYNIMIAHFTARAGNIAKPEEARPANLQLSLSPRRLGDYTNLSSELAIGAAVLLALGLFARNYALARASNDAHWMAAALRQGGFIIWILYSQLGLVLLKIVFVRWRMPLPIKRTEDFRRWRAAWLRWHLALLDSVRLLWALGMAWGVFRMIYWDSWSHATQAISVCAWVVPVLPSFIHISREGRRFKTVEREVKPVQLIKEFPRPPVPDGRFLAGGLLYFNSDNPAIVVRSPSGIAINAACSAPYIWIAYFIGMAVLTIWQLR